MKLKCQIIAIVCEYLPLTFFLREWMCLCSVQHSSLAVRYVLLSRLAFKVTDDCSVWSDFNVQKIVLE